MRSLFLLISFLWVFPSAYQAFNTSFLNSVLIKGEPVGYDTPLHREKRAQKDNGTVSCSKHDYKPKKLNFCCNKCLPGHRVLHDCRGKDQVTSCTPCENETYTDIPNNSKRCESCTICLKQYGQIVLSACTPEKDTQCGCPEGQYKDYTGSGFICKECNTCQNGVQAVKCSDDKDTICICIHNFFFDDSFKRCRPCSECQDEHCKVHCPDPIQSRKPEESNGVILVVLAVVIAVIIAGVVVYAVYKYYARKHSSSSDTTISDSSAHTTLLIENQNQESNEKTLQNLSGYMSEDNLCGVQESTKRSMDGSLPLPDITKGTAPPCLNRPEVVYAIIESIPMRQWREFVRRLGLTNHAVEASEQDYRHYRDAQYAMLQIWMKQEGCSTTKRDQLFNVLREINLGGCIEKIQEHL